MVWVNPKSFRANCRVRPLFLVDFAKKKSINRKFLNDSDQNPSDETNTHEQEYDARYIYL